MARPVQGGAILEVANLGEENGQRIMNVWHYKFDGATTPTADGDALVNVLSGILQGGGADGLLDLLKAQTNEIVTWQSVRYQWITPIRYSPTVVTADNGPGEVADPPLPQNVSGVATLHSMFAGPGGSGRKHFGGLSTTDEGGGEMMNQFLVNTSPILELMMEVVDTGAVQVGSSLVPVIFNRVTPANSIQWTGYTIQDTSRVMRRRTVRVGI